MENKITVSISFAEEDLDLAEKIAGGLMDKGVSVISNSKSLKNRVPNWGRHLFDIVNDDFAKDVNYCIVLVTRDYHKSRWNAKYNRCRLLENAFNRNNFILPVKIGNKVPDLNGLSLVGAIEVEENDFQTIIDNFIEKAKISDLGIGLLKEYKDIEDILNLYDSKADWVKLSKDEDMDREKKIGFDLYANNDLLLEKINYYILYLYEGSTIKNTFEHVNTKYKSIFNNRNLIIIIPQEKGQKDFEKRRNNIKSTFKDAKVIYIHEFIWEYCTPREFRSFKNNIPLKNFVSPDIKVFPDDEPQKSDDFIIDWLEQDDNPLLVMKGSGGIGKTTLAKWLSNYVEDMPNKRAIFIDSTEITSHLRKIVEINNELNLYKFYEADYEERQSRNHREEKLGHTEFRCNIDNGNIILIIDGFDEILTNFDKLFDINSFLASIYTFSSSIGRGKVVITTRNYFWDKYEVHEGFKFQSIEVCPFDAEMTKKYFNSYFPNLPKLVNKSFEILNHLMLGMKDNYSPFVLDLVTYIVANRDGNKEIVDSRFDSAILSQNITNDYLLFKICDREIIKLDKVLGVDDQARFFMRFATLYNSKLKDDKLEKEIYEITENKATLQTIDALKSHPIVAYVQADAELRFKYDLFEEHFKNISLGQLLNGREKLSGKHIFILSDYSSYNSHFHENLAERMAGNDEISKLGVAIDIISDIINHSDKDVTIELKNRALSSLLLILIRSINGTDFNVDKSTEIIRELFFSDGKIRNLSILNCNSVTSPKIVFDFSDLTLSNCVFSNYEYFGACKFNNATRFEDCRFENLHLKHNGKYEFKPHMFFSPKGDTNFNEYLKKFGVERSSTKKEITDDFESFLRSFYKAGKIQNITRLYLIKKYHHKVIPLDKMIKILSQEDLVFEYTHQSKETKYDVKPEHEYAVVKYLTNGTPSTIIEKSLQKLLDNYLS